MNNTMENMIGIYMVLYNNMKPIKID